MNEPQVIQGGMGIAISTWRLARAVAGEGQLGVVSGTAIDSVHARILQDGDKGGELRESYAQFPVRGIAEEVLERWFVPGGKAADAPYRLVPMFSEKPNPALDRLMALSCFSEVTLARGGNPVARVGINLLDKIRIPQLASLYGAMLAGVDYVLMGAGIPRHVPGVLDRFAEGQPASVKFDLAGGEESEVSFDPSAFLGAPAPRLKRPKFFAIITSAALAINLARKASGRVDGFVVETAVAGGHNAPPRGPMQLSEKGEPIYGPRDTPELEKIAAVGLPFWIGGGFASAGKLAEARAAGASGVQVGTAFACCEESAMAPALKRRLIQLAKNRALRVFTNPLASPTGFPFKVTQVPGTLSEPAVYAARRRVCDLGALRSAYRREDGGIGFRCAAEPEEAYVRKGGKAEDAAGRVCLCNGLMAAAGYAQIRKEIATSFEKMEKGVGALVEGISHAMSNAGHAVADAAANASNAVATAAANAGHAVADASQSVANASNAVANAAANAGHAVADAAANASNAVATAAASGVENLKGRYETAVSNIETAVNDIGVTVESMISTAGDSLGEIVRYLKNGKDTYTALDVLRDILGPADAATDTLPSTGAGASA